MTGVQADLLAAGWRKSAPGNGFTATRPFPYIMPEH